MVIFLNCVGPILSLYTFVAPLYMSFESLSLECKVFGEMPKWRLSLNLEVASSETWRDEFGHAFVNI